VKAAFVFLGEVHQVMMLARHALTPRPTLNTRGQSNRWIRSVLAVLG
jgi:hypothetical protein